MNQPERHTIERRLKMRLIPTAFLVLAVAGSHAPALAQQAPGPDEIASALAIGLPAWWQVHKVEIHATVNDGDEITPLIRQRFVADLMAREDLYKVVDEVAPFRVVSATAAAADPFRLYGIGTSTLEKGSWLTEFGLENSVQGMGLPHSMFGGPVVIAGGEASQPAIEAFLQGQELASALAERAAATAANAEVLARLAEEADARDRAVLEDIQRRRTEALKNRIEGELGELDAAVDSMIAASRETLAELESLHEQRIAAAAAQAETGLAIAGAKEEIAAQDELAATLAELATKLGETSEAEIRNLEARIAAGKKRFDALRAGLASSDPSEQMAAFEHALASEDENLRRIALTAAFRSGNDDLQGAALAAYLSGLPQFSITVTYEANDESQGTNLQTIWIRELNGASFSGEFSTPGWQRKGVVTGTVQGDTVSLQVAVPDYGNCSWTARLDEQGVLAGQMQCADSLGRTTSRNPNGVGSVAF